VVTRRGAGPRHAAFHPTAPYAYVLNELDSTLTTYRFDSEGGGLVPLQVITTLPPAFTGDNTTSEIAVAPSGRFVYASNRGHDSIVIFRADGAAGVLEPVGWEPTQGKTPRFFTLDPPGTLLYAANQDSDTIVPFRVDPRAGTLTPTGPGRVGGQPEQHRLPVAPRYETPSTITMSVRPAFIRSARGARYSSESYQRWAAARLGNSITTSRVGFQSPSTVWCPPPRTRNRPPYLARVAGTCLRYSSIAGRSVTVTLAIT
jgi:hypothetical protein